MSNTRRIKVDFLYSFGVWVFWSLYQRSPYFCAWRIMPLTLKVPGSNPSRSGSEEIERQVYMS